MKALVYTGIKEMTLQDMPTPVAKNGDSLIQVEAVGICGSDMHGYLGHDERRPAPLVLGHEAAGTVIDGPKTGQRVTVNPLVTCGTCPACVEGRTNLCPTRQIISMPPREGAFAEFLTMPPENLIPVPDSFDIDKAALAEPLAVCWHGARLAAEVVFGGLQTAHCLVIGGGAIGFGSALCLKAFGADHIQIAETNAGRRAFIADHSDFDTVDGGSVEPNSYDLVIDAVGYRGTRELACLVVRPGGVICHIGLGDAKDGLDIRRMTLQEITFFGTYAYTAQDFRDTTAAMYDGRLGSLDWHENRPLTDGPVAFREILAGTVATPKVVLRP